MVFLPLVLGGCQGMGLRPAGGSITQSDRLMAHYADLSGGRFAVIADFEQEQHLELFRSASPGGEPLHQVSQTAGVNATGGRCLRAEFARPEDELIADGQAARNWSLPRDWREYDLL
ncbi:MAG: hypothetical protein GY842_22075, partial [bacterium]|nr:hypothetical protein [bacterium]